MPSWCEECDIPVAAVLRDILLSLDMDAAAIGALADAPGIAARYRRYTDQAVAAGVFGSPSYVFDGELFWRQDRLDMPEDAVAAARSARL